MAWWDDEPFSSKDRAAGEDPYYLHANLDLHLYEQIEAELDESVTEAVSAE